MVAPICHLSNEKWRKKDQIFKAIFGYWELGASLGSVRSESLNETRQTTKTPLLVPSSSSKLFQLGRADSSRRRWPRSLGRLGTASAEQVFRASSVVKENADWERCGKRDM